VRAAELKVASAVAAGGGEPDDVLRLPSTEKLLTVFPDGRVEPWTVDDL